MTRPNILIFMVDQLNGTLFPDGPADWLHAPNMKKLAARSTRFRNAYTASPLCAPGRASFMSGQLPSATRVYDNAAEFASSIPTYAHHLRRAGYYTCLSGKMHFVGPDQLHGFEERLTTDIYPADYGWFPDWENFEQRPTWYHNMSSVTQAGPTVRTNQLDFDDEVVFHAQRYLFDHVRGSDERPFCLTVSMTHPHDPYAITQEYWDRYSDEEIELPSFEIPAEEQDPHSKRLLHVYQMDRNEISDQQIRNARRAYYGAVSYVDDQIGKLLQTLEDTGLSDNTIVVFSGDHGDMLGERGLWYKMSYFEWSTRVPMLVYAPQHFEPHRVAESVSTMDLLPTFAELANNGQAPKYVMPIDGRSLIPHLTGGQGHDEVIGEYMGEGVVAPMFMIRRGDYKYICSTPDPDQLFNLKTDPQERTNLAEHPDYAELIAAFRAEAAQRWDSEAITRDVIISQKRRRMIAQAHKQGIEPKWDHQPIFDASQMYMRNNIDLDDLEKRARFPQVTE